MGAIEHGAGNGTRTRNPQLGRLMLYQLSYSRSLSVVTNGPQGTVSYSAAYEICGGGGRI